ncbi:MAG: ATP-binding protein [Flavobacteriales bacterium]
MMKFNLTLRTRIYLSMLVMIIVCFVATGLLSFYDHQLHSSEFNESRLQRKEEAVQKSMLYLLNQSGVQMQSDSLSKLFSDEICELSDVHDLFIALYDLRGRYLMSSDFTEKDSLGIKDQINYTALKQLSTGTIRTVIDSTFTHDSKSLVYWYLRDAQDKPLLITNVVYEDLMPTHVSDFIAELGLIYFVLFLIAAVVAYFLARYITRSLAIVGRKMQEVELGRKNAELQWKSEDEIGVLVKQYNRMISELERSAEQLAQTERESAWREMAQQVAHEIKNPLTPMKLRVQHLQRSWQDNKDGFESKLDLFEKSMTEQIDALSRIASEFSSFAKMPKPQLEKINLQALTRSVVELNQGSAVEITMRSYNVESDAVMADKDQTIRILNNLLNNAAQAIPQGRKGKIDVALRGTKRGLLIRINDNGIGISEDQRHKIFVPNFTTKSTGTGLGLAMVKSIMQHCGGNVWFWSREGHGSSFYLLFAKG